jgi:hypothetical protein
MPDTVTLDTKAGNAEKDDEDSCGGIAVGRRKIGRTAKKQAHAELFN